MGGQPRLYHLDDTDYDPTVHDPTSFDEVIAKKVQAVGKSYEWGDRIPLGVFYEIAVPTFEDQIGLEGPGSKGAERNIWNRDLSPLIDGLR